MPLYRTDLIVPTWNNEQYLIPFINSLMATQSNYPFRLILVNNGDPGLRQVIPDHPDILFLQAPSNLGWEGGLQLGLEHSDAEFVGLLNDDLHIPVSSSNWLRGMMSCFADPMVGAVGPTSNCVMGSQAIWNHINREVHTANYLIGFCFLLRRSALNAAGGVDSTLPGGDDIDLSIRLRKKGYHLAVDRRVFVFHHGFKTGTRVHSDWNSQEMGDRTIRALIIKHGFKTWFDYFYKTVPDFESTKTDSEGHIIRSLASSGRVLELGCGDQKTVAESIGVDFYGKGELIPTIRKVSVADVKSSVADLPRTLGRFDTIIARHILEHMTDPIAVLRHWSSFLSPGGSLIVAVPDDRLIDSIPLNPEHKHAFTQDSMRNVARAAGLVPGHAQDGGNGLSFVMSMSLPVRVGQGVSA